MGLLEPDGRYRDRHGQVPLTAGSSRDGVERGREPPGPAGEARRLDATDAGDGGGVPRPRADVGTIVGIARHAAAKAPMEVLEQIGVTVESGLDGDDRGRVKPGGRGRRQVTLMEAGDWADAMAELDAAVEWQERRANLLVDGLDLPQTPGTLLRIGETVVLQVTIECAPCFRMDRVAPGLQAALTPDWRGGVCTRVLAGGRIVVGDQIRSEIS